ncbi:MAG: beta-lactamase family protein [Candidatus Aminicenantes bacterium]|nr:beta-lactamase family protein [Candidatus Aminicenantes bacterium]
MLHKKIGTVFFCLILAICLVWAQQPGEISYHDDPAFPEGPRGDLIRSLIDTINTGGPARIQHFLEEKCTESFRNFAPMEQHLQVFRQFFWRTGGVEFHSIRTYKPERPQDTVVILQDRNYGSWQAFVLGFSADNIPLISRIAFSTARTPTDIEEPALDETGLIREIKSFLDRICEKNIFSGTVLVAKGDNILLTRANGEASKRFHAPNNIDTKFNLGSMNKMFTSTAIVQLAEKGILSLQDPISKYIDESWLPKDVTSNITIHHLLTHTSGLGSYFNDTYNKTSRQQFIELDDYKPLIKDDRPAFEPGERFLYSNTGMFLLGVVIEKATGENYYTYIRNHITGPAGMENTDCYRMDYPVENLAIGYSPDPGNPWGWQNNIYKHVLRGGPAGGGFSTVKDLFRFARALVEGKLVSQESLKILWTDQAGSNYGCGFSVETGAAGKVVGHGGGFPGISSNLDIFLDKDFMVAVMSNIDGGAIPVSGKIQQLIGRLK